MIPLRGMATLMVTRPILTSNDNIAGNSEAHIGETDGMIRELQDQVTIPV